MTQILISESDLAALNQAIQVINAVLAKVETNGNGHSSLKPLAPANGSKGPSLSKTDLGKVGVSIKGAGNQLLLECKQCFREWRPAFAGWGELAPDYWRCPAGCNSRQCTGGMCQGF